MTLLHGIIPVFKPKGYTSHDIVAIIRKLVGQKRIGHTGTLDPDVEGVLPICLGQATRVVEYVQDLPKRYKGSLVLGVATDTQDQSGKIIEQAVVGNITQAQVEEIFCRFTGWIDQVPPMYSALKVNGKKLYELARQGKTVDRPARKVHIYELTCLSIKQGERPVIELDVLCSKGTYIRTLCMDIGKALGYPAHMNALVRTASGPFYAEDCYTLEEIETYAKNAQLSEKMTTLDEVLYQFPSIVVTNEDEKDILNGCAITCDDDFPYTGLFRVYTESGRFCALYHWDKEVGLGEAKKVFWGVENENADI